MLIGLLSIVAVLIGTMTLVGSGEKSSTPSLDLAQSVPDTAPVGMPLSRIAAIHSHVPVLKIHALSQDVLDSVALALSKMDTIPPKYAVWATGVLKEELRRRTDAHAAIIEIRARQICHTPNMRTLRNLIGWHSDWDDEVIATIACARFNMGMTAEQLRVSLGVPDDINRTVTQYGTREQWVYGNTYVYLDDGRITAWQN